MSPGPRVITGTKPPSARLGKPGDFYVNTVTHQLYGPKVRVRHGRNGWGRPLRLTVLTGPAGPAGATGAAGSNGLSRQYVVLGGAGPPASSVGVDGDFFIDTATAQIYGPKSSGSWGSPTSITRPIAGEPGGLATLNGGGTLTETQVPSSVISTTHDIPWDWSFPAETTEKVQFRLTPPTGAPFEFVTYGAKNSDDTTYDHVSLMGFNASVMPEGGLAAEPAFYMGFEDGWWDGATMGAEWYVAYYSPDHASVKLFRPFYTRVQRNNNFDHSALTLCDIGEDATGLWAVAAGNFKYVFSVTNEIVTFKPTAKNGFFILDAVAGKTPTLQFRNAGSNAFSFNSSDLGALLLNNKDGAPHGQFISGGSAAAALTEFISVLRARSSVVVGNEVLAKDATDGFLYLPTCSGVPTGTPTARTGTVPIVFDTENKRLYIYESAGWHYFAEAA